MYIEILFSFFVLSCSLFLLNLFSVQLSLKRSTSQSRYLADVSVKIVFEVTSVGVLQIS